MTLSVRGGPTPDELAALVAVLSARDGGNSPNAYERWRAGRLGPAVA